MSDTYINGLLSFIEKSPTSFQAVQNTIELLSEQGFERLDESVSWNLVEGGRYYVTRNESAIIAFRIPCKSYRGFQIISSHGDSPSFKVKENPEIRVENHYVKLNVEKYGGMICAPWFDRPLSVAGRVVVETDSGLETRFIHIDRDLLIIPNLAIHMNREVNDGYTFNLQKDLLPLWSDGHSKESFLELLAKEVNVQPNQIKGSDLFLYNRMRGSIWGTESEFISAPRLDDIECAYASLQGLLQSNGSDSVAVHCMLDNEEVGSASKQGAASTFLSNVLHRINSAMGRSEEAYMMSLSNSFMISADNAHAVHPNYADKTDPTNRPFINEGIVIKHSANQKYTTDAVSDAVFRCICESVEAKYQHFHNRSDMLGGSTLGNISNAQVALNTVDVGLPQLAMHSPYETAGVRDFIDFIHVSKKFYNTSIAYENGKLLIKE
ncbi:MAG: M18 family aminopeptidase [Candidatus Fimivivens sp.]|nr:M18 family aminopeptidase [Candidatus Fimivivens sp.]